MTTISSNHQFQQAQSPKDRLQNALQAQVASGAISETDGTALSGALDSIDSALQGSAPSQGSSRPDPGQIKSKIDDLISQQVDSGTLTSDQADELRTLFQQNAPGSRGADGSGQGGGGPAGPGGPGGPGGAGGPPPGPPPSASASGSDSDSDDASSSSSSSSSSLEDLLADFLKNLQQATGTNSTYDASGSNQASTGSLVVDYTA